MDNSELEIYLRQIRRTPLLTAEQEAMAVRRLESRRYRLRFKLLCSPAVLHGAMTLAKQVAAGQMRAEHIIELDVRDLAKKHHIIGLVQPVLTRVHALHIDSVRAYQDWRRDRRRIGALRLHLRHRREMIDCFEQLEVRLEKLWELGAELVQSHMQAAKPSRSRPCECGCHALATEETDARWCQQVCLFMNSYAQAKNALVAANLPLVVSVAKRYHRQGRDLLDLVQEGNLGLLRAADKFKSSFRGRFTTYAVWWIRQALQKVARQAPLVRPSHDAASAAREIEHRSQILSHEIGRAPTWAEIANAMNLDERAVEQSSIMFRPVLSVESGADSDRQAIPAIRDPGQGPGEQVEAGLLRQRLGRLMSALDERAYQVVALRYGWDGHGKRTLVEISGMLGVSRARVSQIEQAALKKLCQQWKLSSNAWPL